MPAGIPYEEARKRYRPGVTPPVRSDDGTVEALLKGFHPDHGPNARVALAVGVPLNLNTQFMGSGRAHWDGILAGAEGNVPSQAHSARFPISTRTLREVLAPMDRAEEKAGPKDVGEQALMRGLDTAFPLFRLGLSLV